MLLTKQVESESGRVAGFLLTLFIVFAVFLGGFYFVFGKVVPPNAIGLRQNYFGVPLLLSKGFEEKGLSPGLHWRIPGISEVHLIPRTFQIISLKGDYTPDGINLVRLEIPTTDGSKVQTNLTLVLRYFEAPEQLPAKIADREESAKDAKGVPVPVPSFVTHGGPKELVNTFTTSSQVQLNTLVIVAEDYLKRSLSALSTTDYYNPALREAAALKATDEINKQINPSGVGLWATLIQRYVYSEKNIDDQIFAKNLQNQTERLNAALSSLAEAKASTEEARANWDAKINVLRSEGEAKARVLESEAVRYEKEKYAEGEKLTALATADVESAKNAAYAAPGADIFVARKMLPILSTLRGGVVSGFDPFDVGSWLKRFSPASSHSSATVASPPSVPPPSQAPPPAARILPASRPALNIPTAAGSNQGEGGEK